ncbi:MAG TPA: hypothetical protein VHP14_17100 [Anaerolineales bacterium]|nr:hypothetical protein [Anaerolineales bacterium]
MQSKANQISAISNKRASIHIVVLFIAYVIFSLIVAGPGMLHFEMYTRLPAHISGKPILQIIFDAKSMNLGGWEARQLSFLFDVIDGNFVAFCIRHGFPHFRSLTHYVFTLILILYLWLFFTRTLRLDRWLSHLLIALMLTTPSFIYSFYYRTSKIGVTLLVIILSGEIYKLIKGELYLDIKIQKPTWLALIFLLATLSLMLFDVLGGFFATALIAYLFLALVYKPDRSKSAALAGMIAGYTIWVLYFLYWGPAITLAITGQKADVSYLNSAPFQYFPGFLFITMPSFIADMLRYLFGYVPQAGGAIFVVWLAISIWLVRPKKKTSAILPRTATTCSKKAGQKILFTLRSFFSRYEPALTLLFILASIAIIYALLATRHAPILWPDVRPTYYIMPAQAVLLLSLATFLARARIKWMFKSPPKYYITLAILIFFLVGNIIGSIRIKSFLFSGQNTKLFPHGATLIDSLVHVNSPNFKPDKKIAEDPIYQLFSNQ